MTENNQSGSGLLPELIAITIEEIRSKMKEIVAGDIAIFRKNNENKLVTIPAAKLQLFISESSSSGITLYIDKNWKQKIIRKTDEQVTDESIMPVPEAGSSVNFREKMNAALQKYGQTTEQMEKFQLMSIVEREELLDLSIEKLHGMNETGGPLDIDAIIRMVEVVANTYYANYANLEDAMETENVKSNLFGIFIKTEWVLKLIISIFKNNGTLYGNYLPITSIETGSYTIDNMCKSVMQFIGFSLFYNDYIERGLVTGKNRSDYKERYSRYYDKRLPVDMISIERIIKGGLRRIDVDTDLPLYAAGALLYDIGKLPVLSYHDEDNIYDENIARMHVLIGYNMILKTKKYPFTVYAMAAFHHEYYGDKSGYNFTNPVISKITQKKRTEDNAGYFITFDEKEFKEGVALAFFPCKIIEIIDIFNTLTVREHNHPLLALKIMKKNFIALCFKIDPLIFDIFIQFTISCGLINQGDRKEIDDIIY